MRPAAAITAILFGSCVAIAFGLTGVLIISLFLRGESEQLQSEAPRLLAYCGAFWAASAVAGMALYGQLKNTRWQYWAQALMWLLLTAATLLAWPK